MNIKKVVIDSVTQSEIVQSLSEKLNAYYVFPDLAKEVGVGLQKHLADGEYKDITDGATLALILTKHMQEVSHDKHLLVQWYPEPLPDQDGPIYQNQELVDEWHQQAKLDNFGLHKVERLPGNVGYLDIHEFYNSSWAGDTVVAAMNFLANTSILIVDLRKCRGGDPDTVALICSYFFDEEPVHLNDIYWHDEGITHQFWTLPYVSGKRFGNKPIYVLISKDTFSGGEEFAYNLKTLQRATLIGETSGGGAQPGTTYRLYSHFDVFIPCGRAINPITGTNWEGTGVTPDIAVPQEQVLGMAYRLALINIIENLEHEKPKAFNLLKKEAQNALRELES